MSVMDEDCLQHFRDSGFFYMVGRRRVIGKGVVADAVAPAPQFTAEAGRVNQGMDSQLDSLPRTKDMQQEETTMAETQQDKAGFFNKLKRGAATTFACIVVCSVASMFVPGVPLVVAVAIGGVSGGALATATTKK